MQNSNILIAAVIVLSVLVYNRVSSDNTFDYSHIKKSQTAALFDFKIHTTRDKLTNALQLTARENQHRQEFTLAEQASMNKMLSDIQIESILVENTAD